MTTDRQSYTALIPIVGATSVVGGFVLYSRFLGGLQLGPLCPVVLTNSSHQLIALRGAFLFAVSATLLTVALLYVICLSIRGTWVLASTEIEWRALPFKKSLVALMSILILAGLSLGEKHVGSPVTDAIEKAICEIEPGSDSNGSCEPCSQGPTSSIGWIILGNNGLTIIAIWLAVLMSTALIIATSQTRHKQKLPPLVRQSQLALYSFATLLSIGVGEMFFLYRWGGDLLNLDGQLPVVNSAVSSLTLGFGAFFSTLLVILFVPLLLVQREKLKELNTGTLRWRGAWLDDHGLSRSLFPALTEIGAMLMPLATSLISM